MTRKSKTIPLAAHRAQRTRVTLESAARELNENLASLQTLLKQLLDEANEKLAAMRAADTERMQRCTGREADLLEQVARVEEQRTAIVACLAQRMPDQMPRGPSLREISQALPEPVSPRSCRKKTSSWHAWHTACNLICVACSPTWRKRIAKQSGTDPVVSMNRFTLAVC